MCLLDLGFYDVSIGLGILRCVYWIWDSTMCLLDLGIVPTVWYCCAILDLGIVPTVWYFLFRRICYSSQFVNMSHNLEHFISMSVCRFIRLLNWSIYSRSRLEIHPPFKSSMSVKYFVTLSTHLILISLLECVPLLGHLRRRHGRDRMVVGFITTCAINVYHHRSWEVVLDAILLCSWQTIRSKMHVFITMDVEIPFMGMNQI